MKTLSNKKLPALQDLGSGRWYYHYDEKTIINKEDNTMQFEYTTITFKKKPGVDELLVRLPSKKHKTAIEAFVKITKQKPG